MKFSKKSKKQFEKLCHDAVQCRDCFNLKKLNLESPDFNVAQPRWVGPNYRAAKPRILIMMLNPGAGFARKNKETRNELKEFAKSGDKKNLIKHLMNKR
jgi:hypothetical protein